MDKLKLVFAGTPDFAVPALEALLAGPHRLLAVYTQPDRPAGRGRKLKASPVKVRALAEGVPVLQPVSLKPAEEADALARLRADLMVVVAYGLLLPRRVLEAPRLGCVNIHASLLPRWRGAAPIQRALLAGDRESGISIMQMEAGLDTGPVLLTRKLPIAAGETGGSLHDKLALLGAQALSAALPGIADGSLQPRAQDPGRATYAPKLDKREALIDWSQSALELDRRIHAFNPWPVAQTALDGANLRVWLSEPIPGESSARPGTVVDAGKQGIDVATGEGLLRITRLQLPGKRPMGAAEFLNARALDGVVLG